jgi:hypothetical protein
MRGIVFACLVLCGCPATPQECPACVECPVCPAPPPIPLRPIYTDDVDEKGPLWPVYAWKVDLAEIDDAAVAEQRGRTNPRKTRPEAAARELFFTPAYRKRIEAEQRACVAEVGDCTDPAICAQDFFAPDFIEVLEQKGDRALVRVVFARNPAPPHDIHYLTVVQTSATFWQIDDVDCRQGVDKRPPPWLR